MASTSIPVYSLEELAKCGDWGDDSLDSPDDDLLVEMISMGSDEHTENKRYYVSDTDLIERRFLKDATESFDRDIDPFSESKLFTTELECVYQNLGIYDIIADLTSRKFLTDGNSHVEFQDILVELQKKYGSVKIGNKFRTINDESSSYEKIVTISSLTYTPIVIEDPAGTIWDSSWTANPSESEPNVLWIRKVVDGFLGLIGTQKSLEEGDIWKPKCDHNESNGITHTVRRKVPEIKSELERLGITFQGLKKKGELVEVYSKSVLFPERFLSTVS